MLEALLFIVVFSLSVIGLSDLIHCIWLAFIKPKDRARKTLLCYLSGNFADLQLEIAYEELLWYGKNYADELIAIDYNIEKSVLADCIEYAKEKNIKFISKERLNKDNIMEL